MRRYAPLIAAVVIFGLQIGAMVALGHDCSSQSDCEETSGYNGAIALIGGIIAIIAGILGTSLGGPATMPTTQRPEGGVAAEPRPTEPRAPSGGRAPSEPAEATTPSGRAEPPSDRTEPMPRPGRAEPTTGRLGPQPTPGREPQPTTGRTEPIDVPFGAPGTTPSIDEIGELFGPEPEPRGGEPTTAGPTETPTTTKGPGMRVPPPTAPLTGPTVEEIQELFGPEEPTAEPGTTSGPEPTKAGGTDTTAMPPSGTTATPPSDVTKPGEEPPEEPTATKPARTPRKVDEGKALGQDTLEKVSDFTGQVTQGIDWTKEQIDKLGISDKSKEELKEGLDKVGGPAGDIKDAADKANEYVQALDENLQKTGKMGVTEQSRDFLGWWRVTFKAAGELTQTFVDKVASPVTGFIKKTTGKDAEEMLHNAVPIKEFGDELSKLPTSAAQNVVSAQNRDQIDEAQQAWHGKTPDPDDLSDMFPRDWTKVK
jgi:hypothetical protein